MRCLALILLLAVPAPAAEDPALHETRAWRGVIEIASVSKEPPLGSGREIQKERIEFVVWTDPPKRSFARPRLPLQMREGSGRYELTLDLEDGEGESRVVKRGAGSGRVYPRVAGYVEPTIGRYRLLARVSPDRLLAKTMMSGMAQGRFTTWRTVVQRRPFLASFDVQGQLSESGRVMEGRKSFLDKKAPLARNVEVTWRVERIDPVVAGRVVDHAGRPVAGLKVIARHTNPGRRRKRLPPLVREGTTDAEGRFRIDAFFAPWSVEAVGEERDGLVVEGARIVEAVQLRADDVPSIDVSVRVYRLAALPQPRLLRRYFDGDVYRYLEYVRPRAPAALFQRALLPPPAER